MARYRTYTIEFKRRVAEEHPSGGVGPSELARRHDLSRELLRIRVKKYETGEFAGDGPPRADRRADEARIAGLERKVGQPTMELDLLKRGLVSARRARGAPCSLVSGPLSLRHPSRVPAHEPGPEHLLLSSEGEAGRSRGGGAEARLIARIHEICAEFPRYGYRRVTAQLKAEGERVNRKRVARIMREQDLRVRPKRRFVATTDGDHDGPVRPDRRGYEAKIAGLERKVGQLTMELDLLNKGLRSARRAGGGSSSVVSGPKPAAFGPGAAS